MIRPRPTRLVACAATLTLVGALLSPLGVQAQIAVGNSVFPQAGDTLHYALDRSPGPAIQVTPPGGPQNWDFSSLASHAIWTETLRPAATGTGAEFFGEATLVYTQTGPASVNFPLLPGSNGSEAYLQVTHSAVHLLGFHGGSDAGRLGVGAFVKPASTCNGAPNCTPDLRTVFFTRYDPLYLTSAPKNIFDIRQNEAGVIQEYPATDIPGLSNLLPTLTGLRIRVAENSVSFVDAFGTLLLPGGSFEVLREKTNRVVELRLDANVPPLGWLDITDTAAQLALLDVRWGTWEQSAYRYFDAVSKESLATTYSPIALHGQADSDVIEQVRFKDTGPLCSAASADAGQEDTDGDGVSDACDVCTLEPNGPVIPDAGGTSQRDADGDGFGNLCDGDFDQNGVVNFADLAVLKQRFFSGDPVADFDGDGLVNFVDLARFKALFLKAPGPAAP